MERVDYGMLGSYGWAVLTLVIASASADGLDEFPEDHTDIVFVNKDLHAGKGVLVDARAATCFLDDLVAAACGSCFLFAFKRKEYYRGRRPEFEEEEEAGGVAQPCSICINGRPIIKRTKRSLDCVPCTYLQPTESINNPFAAQSAPVSPAGIYPRHLREKRAGCLPHPECTFAPRRVRRNLESQYCEPCNGGYYGRKKREAEIEKCHRREKRAVGPDCEADEFLVTRMKRQAYNPKGILDIVKVLSKTMAGEPGPGGCMKFPACVLAQTKRRKRHAERMEQYHKEVAAQRQAHMEQHEQHIRQKRQFFAPDAAAACVPCPAWVTLALASRKKRSTNSSEEDFEREKPMSLSEAIADIRKKAGYKLGFDDDGEAPRRRQGSCDQTDDCLNDVEYAIFKKVYHNTRVKRETFKKRKCERCGSGFDGRRVKRNFGAPTINASEQDCNICTPNISKKRKKRHADTPQCYPCPGTKA
ncbi:hypothetical protein ANCCEY_07433 [Ancylostoma ceylanicum]|uniref:Uncharacterized protein n=1 Tax=Ancylostoma ceylanicum TaxID=53326 RepID=A0A0D6LNQ2_9BILA|nr:hypothetical protein ANCCEY_07433 [Ancylostoma ceylanicum]